MSDLNQAVPETELLDNSIQKGRAQLSVRAHRHRPSRSHYRDSVSSTEGDDSLERRVRLPYGDIITQTLMTSANVCVSVCYQDSPLHSTCSPLNLAMQGSPPPPDSLLSARSPAFLFDTSLVRPIRVPMLNANESSS